MHPAVGDALDLGDRRYDVAMSAPTRPATMTLAEVRECVARVLPGARVRRRLFWRWTLVHRASAAGVR
ncbi:hypothetical protein [Cellulomonas olei]|uniref:hypothetical protein n=1 Tax=Cellulomonas sp. P4 TaxID=3142533 RepID=UPI0031BA7F11